MADLTKSAGALIAEVRAAVSRELLESLQPIVRKMTEAAEELERALGGAGKPKAARPGRKPKVATHKVARSKRAPNPRGALQGAIREALQKSKEALRLSDLRDRILEGRLFKGRDKVVLYNQIAGALKRMPDVLKTADKSYTPKPASGSEKSAAAKVRKITRRKPAKSRKAEGEAG